jgi:phospholipase/lecithinase/hemolysin
VPCAPIPELPYDSKRFSNGNTWAEVLAEELGNYRGGLPAYQSRWFGNYAVAGARINGLSELKPTLGDQVNKQLAAVRGAADPSALYVVQFGGSDSRDPLEAAAIGGDSGVVIGSAITGLAEKTSYLSNAGARRFLRAKAPIPGTVPVIVAIGAGAPAEYLSIVDNGALHSLLSNLAISGPSICRLDLFSFLDVATVMPQGFGVADAATPCLQVFEAPATGVCDDPDQHLFWDGLHPTRAGHRLAGSIAVNPLSLD